MPYNTRRKSLSLPSLGIHVPVTHAARAASRRSPTVASSATTSATSTRTSSPATSTMASPSSREAHHPNKKAKRAHSEDSDGLSPSASLSRKPNHAIKFDHTPPPSPPPADRASVEMVDAPAAPAKKVDLEGINDEIVEAVIVQLQSTDNRPHLVKELAAILMRQLRIVQQSANPCAIISSRLSTYLKRNCWSALTPCPLAKELETVHPRRTYFYLTIYPHQPLPGPAHAAALSQLAHARAIISPSLSSAASVSANSEDGDFEDERRRQLSPSPEVDLSSPEFDDVDDDIAMPSTPIGSLSMRGFGLGPLQLANGSAPGSVTSSRHQRAASPPLEKDEKEFTQTADGLQKRKLSAEMLASVTASPEQGAIMELDFGTRDDSGLFDDRTLLSATFNGLPTMTFMTSPAIKPAAAFTLSFGKKDGDADGWAKLDHMLGWDRNPENIELEELDGLLNDY